MSVPGQPAAAALQRGAGQGQVGASGSPTLAPPPGSLPPGADGAKHAGAGAGGAGVKGEAGSEVEDIPTGKAQAGLTSAQLLLKIQMLDEAIAATDGEIASLQADALHGEGAIFGMSVARKEKWGPVLDAHGKIFLKVLSVLALYVKYNRALTSQNFLYTGMRLLDINNQIVAMNREALLELMLTADPRAYHSQPLYVGVEDSPDFQVCRCMHTDRQAHTHTHTHAHTHTHTHICIYLYIHIHVYISVEPRATQGGAAARGGASAQAGMRKACVAAQARGGVSSKDEGMDGSQQRKEAAQEDSSHTSPHP